MMIKPSTIGLVGVLACGSTGSASGHVDLRLVMNATSNVLLDQNQVASFMKSFDDFYTNFQTCFSDYKKLEEKSWTGYVTYWELQANGTLPDDQWRKFNASWKEGKYDLTNNKDPHTPRGDGPGEVPYPEMSLEGNNITVYEICNTASNMAYYRAAGEMCGKNAITFSRPSFEASVKQSYATLGFGSYFYHSSWSNLGSEFDQTMIRILAFLGYQEITGDIVALLDPIANKEDKNMLLYLSATGGSNASEVSAMVSDVISTKDVSEWLSELQKLDIPNMFVTFGSIVMLFTLTVVPDNAFLVSFAKDAIKLFLTKDQLDQVDNFVATLLRTFVVKYPKGVCTGITGIFCKLGLIRKFFGMLLKIVYAFVFQEEVLKGLNYTNELMEAGKALTHYVLKVADVLGGYHTPDAELEGSTENVWAGRDICYSPHALWHEVSASGLLNLMEASENLADNIPKPHKRLRVLKERQTLTAVLPSDPTLVAKAKILFAALNKFVSSQYPQFKSTISSAESVFLDILSGNVTFDDLIGIITKYL